MGTAPNNFSFVGQAWAGRRTERQIAEQTGRNTNRQTNGCHYGSNKMDADSYIADIHDEAAG